MGEATVLTHGRFDPVGVLQTLAADWGVPVEAHWLERPCLNGSRSYLPADPGAGGGLLALLLSLTPKRPVDITARLYDLSPDGTLPLLPARVRSTRPNMLTSCADATSSLATPS